MSADWYQDVVTLHKTMGVSLPEQGHLEAIKHRDLRKTLISEEVGELLEGLDNNDLVAIADGIADSIVVLLGTAVTYGIDIRPIWDEVHKTNMRKVGGVKRSDGKFLKPTGWQPPNVRELLIIQGLEVV